MEHRATGKSSLVLRFVKGQLHEYQESTIGVAFLTQTVCLDEATIKFEIWDTAGQERYHSLAPMYYRGAQAAIVVYDITNQLLVTCFPSLFCACRLSLSNGYHSIRTRLGPDLHANGLGHKAFPWEKPKELKIKPELLAKRLAM
ncbi:hypothetical protein PRIPAC_77946 [Pristionchus pacificus]|uniref:ADP ribosylation factor n=1 Tax=Pristionchus pacificus TaxID=54126 RepID=A0A2A6CME4_PRIPA|nr:hypothetical protein PRIPAC_77946 [Pristionchus pacificus]|eukprot:PDM79374.1 ADP ribosylation factor [Pristionchus pacificus]